jgi:hypothetical protein
MSWTKVIVLDLAQGLCIQGEQGFVKGDLT